MNLCFIDDLNWLMSALITRLFLDRWGKIFKNLFQRPLRWLRWRHDFSSSGAWEKPRKPRKSQGKWWGCRKAAVGRVKFTAKHLFVCARAIVRRTFNKPRVLREKIFERRKKIKNNKTKKNSETFSSVRHQNCSSRGFRFKCKWKFSCFNFFSEWNWRNFAWKVAGI